MPNEKERRIKTTITKLVHGGQGMGKTDNRVVFAWNALPGETVEGPLVVKKKNYAEMIGHEIGDPSPERCAPQESHYLSCSPWQIMSYAYENRSKCSIAEETYASIGKITMPAPLTITAHPDEYGYRNKIEYSFFYGPQGELSLAFHERGKYIRKPIDACLLAKPVMNQAAAHIQEWLRMCRFPVRSLKTLVLRAEGGHVCAQLFLKDAVSILKGLESDFPFKGMSIHYSNPQSPVSKSDALLWERGTHELEAMIKGQSFVYGMESFFQVNIPVFEDALSDMREWIDMHDTFVDMYAGVGSIGLSLAAKHVPCVLVECNEEAARYARRNAERLEHALCTVVHSTSEKALEYITSDRIMIVDPPRAGLHTQVIKRIHEEKPKRIIYLSCNVATQARDLQLLHEIYSIRFCRLYNFFPRTPHIEALCVLDRKG